MILYRQLNGEFSLEQIRNQSTRTRICSDDVNSLLAIMKLHIRNVNDVQVQYIDPNGSNTKQKNILHSINITRKNNSEENFMTQLETALKMDVYFYV